MTTTNPFSFFLLLQSVHIYRGYYHLFIIKLLTTGPVSLLFSLSPFHGFTER